jgi:hypothetical protein
VTDGPGYGIQRPAGTAPGWLRLVRAGTTITGYYSLDGSTWTLLGSDTLTMPATVYVGLAVTSFETTSRATATFTNVNVTSASSNQPPTVSITSPANGATYTAGANVTINANAADSNGTITKVDFYQGSTFIASDTSAPYSATWSNAAAGSYALTAIAVDNGGASTTSAAVNVTVNGANQPPTVSITSPANGATFTTGANVTVNATAADSNGTITKVDFYRGTTLIGSDTSAPYSITWNNAAAGSYALTAVAFDNSSASTTSAAVNVTVSGGTSQPPTRVVFNPSPDHATKVSSYSVALRRAGDPVTAAPVATKDLGKPAPVNNDITVDISDIVNPLPAGSYYAVVTAIGPGGSGSSTPSGTFTK